MQRINKELLPKCYLAAYTASKNQGEENTKVLMTIQELKAVRERLGIAQAAVARATSMTRFKLSLAECGHIDLRAEELNAIAHFLATELEQVKDIELPQAALV